VGIFGFSRGKIQKFPPLKIPLRGDEVAEHRLKKFNLQCMESVAKESLK